MKIIALLAYSLLITSGLFSQGIKFREGTWAEMLEAAKREKKMVMADFSTVWCGVCRLMEKNVFTEKKVEDFFNSNFICYALDAEKGEGKALAKQYEIGNFPTFLFVDHSGNAIFKTIGYRDSDTFIRQAQTALREYRKGSKSLAEWESEYIRKKNNPSFLLKYLKRREELGLNNADLLDQYCRTGKSKDLKNPKFISILTNRRVQINAEGPCFQYIISHLPEICSLTGKNETEYLYSLENAVMSYSKQKAIKEKNDTLFNALLKANTFFNTHLEKDSLFSDLKLKSSYYAGIRNVEKYEKIACRLADYIQANIEEAERTDSANYATFLNSILTSPHRLDSLLLPYNYSNDPMDARLFHIALRDQRTRHINQLSFDLSDLAQQAIRLAQTPAFSKQVLLWAVNAVALNDSFSNEAILAEVLYISGSPKEGIEWMKKARKKAIREMQRTDGFAAQIQKKIEKMENNEPL